MRDTTDLGKQRLQGGLLASADEFSTSSAFTLSIEFPVRSEGDEQMVNVPRSLTTIALGDVRRNGKFVYLLPNPQSPIPNPLRSP
jgi:hypothetical protein